MVSNVHFLMTGRHKSERLAPVGGVYFARAMLNLDIIDILPGEEESRMANTASPPNNAMKKQLHGKFYPVPASENVLFEYDSIFGENSSLVIYNSMGMMVKTIQLGKNDSKTAFSVAGFSPGVYTGHLLINKTFKQTSKLTVIR